MLDTVEKAKCPFLDVTLRKRVNTEETEEAHPSQTALRASGVQRANMRI
jgi:hypothetical protein